MMPTLKTTIDEFLVDRQIRGNTEKTISNYNQCISYFCEYVGEDIEVEDINIKMLKSYHLYLINKDKYDGHIFKPKTSGKLEKVTIQTYIRQLRVYLKFLYDEGYIESDLTEKFKLPRSPRKVITIFDDEEINSVYDAFKETSELQLRNKCIIALMLDCGLRRTEVRTLEYPNIHFTNNYIKIVGKGQNERLVPLGLITKRLLLKYINKRSVPLESTTRLFIDKNMKPMSDSALKMMIRRLANKLEMDVFGCHKFRHTFATHYIINGGDIFSLQMILGHTSLDMVRRYSHLASYYLIANHKKVSPLDNSQNKRKV